MTTLNVNRSTSAAELATFLKDNKGSARISATKTGEDQYTLYLRKDRSSVMDRLSGKAAQRNQEGAAAIKLVMNNFIEKSSKFRGKNDESMFESILNRYGTSKVEIGEDHKALRRVKIQKFAEGMAKIEASDAFKREPFSAHSDRQMLKAAHGPQVNYRFSSSASLTLAQSLKQAEGGADAREATIGRLADAMDKIAKDTGLKGLKLSHLAMSDGSHFLAAMRSKLEKSFDQLNGTRDAPLDKDVASALTDAFERFAENALGTAQVGPMRDFEIMNGSSKETHSLPVLDIKGKEYRPISLLGKAGFGMVLKYENVKNPGDAIAFKIILKDKLVNGPEYARALTTDEALAHQEISAASGKHAIGFKGAVRLEGGHIGLAMELGSGKTLDAELDRLKDEVDNGKVSVEQSRLNRAVIAGQIVDVLIPLQAKGILHRDFKKENMMLGVDGGIKLFDFGTTAKIGDRLHERGEINNPIPKAPEILKNQVLVLEAAKNESTEGWNSTDVLLSAINKKPGSGWKGHVERELREINIDHFKHERGIRADASQDVWAAGITIYEFMAGRRPYDGVDVNNQMTRIEDRMVAWASGGNPVFVAAKVNGQLPANALMESTGDRDMDQFLNNMMKADPAQRPTLTEVRTRLTALQDQLANKLPLPELP